MQVKFGKQEDIVAWMKLVQEISWNFPGLETQEKLEVANARWNRIMREGRYL